MIEKALFDFLTADTTFLSLVSSGSHVRIYPLVIPQKTGVRAQMPCVVYAVTADSRQKTYCGTSKLVEVSVSIDCYGSTMKQARDLATELRSLLLDYRGFMGSTYVSDVSLINSISLPDMEPGLYRVSDTYSVWYKEE